jgi:type III secretory pathway component EscV
MKITIISTEQTQSKVIHWIARFETEIMIIVLVLCVIAVFLLPVPSDNNQN